MTTIRLSWVRFVLLERSSETLKFGFPVMVVSDVHLTKQFKFKMEFCPNPSGSVSDVSDRQDMKHPLRFVAACPNPSGSVSDVSDLQ